MAVKTQPYHDYIQRRGSATAPIYSGRTTRLQRHCASRYHTNALVTHLGSLRVCPTKPSRFAISTSDEWAVSLTGASP
jgi:hypothetical protein